MILADVLSGLVEIDTDLLLAINGWRAEWADFFMYAFSGKWIWVPLYVALFYVIVRNLHWKVAIGCARGHCADDNFCRPDGSRLLSVRWYADPVRRTWRILSRSSYR